MKTTTTWTEIGDGIHALWTIAGILPWLLMAAAMIYAVLDIVQTDRTRRRNLRSAARDTHPATRSVSTILRSMPPDPREASPAERDELDALIRATLPGYRPRP